MARQSKARQPLSKIEQPVFVLRLRPLPQTDAIRELRALLKRALRSHGFKCLSVEQEQQHDR